MVRERVWVLSRPQLLSRLPKGETVLLLGEANQSPNIEDLELFTDENEARPHPQAALLSAQEIIALLFHAKRIING